MEDYFFSIVLVFFPLLTVALMFALAQYQKMKKRVRVAIDRYDNMIKDYIRLAVEEAYRKGRKDMEKKMTGEELVKMKEENYKEFYDLYEEDEEFDSDEFDSDEFFQEVYEDALQHMDSVVHHPKHYNQYGDLEVIDIITEATKNMQGDKGYVFGNILKYLLRAPFKGKFEEDVAKANWYWKYYKNGGKENLNE